MHNFIEDFMRAAIWCFTAMHCIAASQKPNILHTLELIGSGAKYANNIKYLWLRWEIQTHSKSHAPAFYEGNKRKENTADTANKILFDLYYLLLAIDFSLLAHIP